MSEKIPLQVLLVDDDANIRRTLSMSLKDMGCVVEVASSVDEALEKLEAPGFDLVLTDFKMAGQTGLDLVRRVMVLMPTLPVVVMTAYSSIENAVSVVKEGAFDYLPKPFTTAQLRALLMRVLEHVRRAAPIDAGTIEEMEKQMIMRVLATEKNQERAAEILGITKVTLWRKRKQYGLP